MLVGVGRELEISGVYWYSRYYDCYYITCCGVLISCLHCSVHATLINITTFALKWVEVGSGYIDVGR